MKYIFKSIITLLFILSYFRIQASDVIPPIKEEEYYKEGKRQLEHLMQQNALNDANGESYKNNYIFFLTDQAAVASWQIKKDYYYDFSSAPVKALEDAEILKVNAKLKELNSVSGATPIYMGIHKEIFKLVVRNLLSTTSGVSNTDFLQPEQKGDIETIISKYSEIFITISNDIDKTKYPNYAVISMAHFIEVKNQEEKVDGESKIKPVTKDWWISNFNVTGPNFTDAANKEKIRSIVFNGFSPYPGTDIASKLIEFADKTSLGIENYPYMQIAENCTISTFNDLVTTTISAKDKLYIKVKQDIIDNANNDNGLLVFDFPDAFKDNFNKIVLPDRLKLLVDYGSTGYKLRVIFKRVPFALSREQQILFAQEIGKEVIADDKTILMVVPYFVSYCANNNGLFGSITSDVIGRVMPAVFCNDATIKNAMNKAITDAMQTQGVATNWEKLFGEAFKKIPKQHIVFKYGCNLKLDIANLGTESKITTGFDKIFDFELWYDYRIKELKEAEDTYKSESTVITTSQYDINASERAFATTQAAYNKFAATITTINNSDPKWTTFDHDLKESVLFSEANISEASQIVHDFTAWFRDETGGTFIQKWVTGAVAPDKINYVSGFNPAVKSKVFAVIDATSLVLSPFGADFAADAVGIYAGYYFDDVTQTAIYTAALVIPASGLIKAGFTASAFKNAYARGKMVVKNADGTWKFSDNILDLKAYAKNLYQNFTLQEFKAYFNIATYGNLLAQANGKAIGAVATRGTVDVIEIEAKEVLPRLTEDYIAKGVLKDADIRMMDNGSEFLETVGDVVVAEHKTSGAKCLIGSALCFAKGTLVKTEKGDLSIEQITEGVSVWSYDEKSKSKVLNKVVRVFRNATTKMMRLVVGKDTILTTPEHPFYCLDPSSEISGRWTKASELTSNAKILLLSGMLAVVNMVQPIDTFATVYNFEVENTHNYYVGTEGVLAHNSCNLAPLRDLLGNNQLWADFAANLKGLSSTLTKAERQAFYGKLNEVFKGDKVGLEKFINDFNSNSVFRNSVANNNNSLSAWKVLSQNPEWVRLNTELLAKAGDNPQLLNRLNDYYSKAIPANTPSGFNGEGVYGMVNFNKFGHPELKPHVSNPNHIVEIDMKGNYTTDFTEAKKALETVLAPDEKIVKFNPTGGWSPFYIEKNGVKSGPYTWHHHQDGRRMYPVKKDIHDSIVGKHTGGREIVTKYPELKGFFNQD